MTHIVSWNINSIRVRTKLIEKLLKELNPDILMLQEIKCTEDEFPSFLNDINYNKVIKGQKGKYGVAILLKKEISFSEIKINSSILNQDSRICGIRINDKNIFNVYTPNGNPMEPKNKFEYKLNWLNELKKLAINYIANYEELVIGGDFNVIENASDVKDFSLWINDALGHIEGRKKFREIMSLGLINAVRLFQPPGQFYSFWDYQNASWERNDGMLIDHFLISPKTSNRIESFHIENNYRALAKPSDHVPICMKLKN
jgi:exodeoxyribonuclease-3